MSDEIFVTGKIKWFKASLGYGFATVDGYGQDIFLHMKRLKASKFPIPKQSNGSTPEFLIENDKIKFKICEGTKGPYADAISRA